MDIVKKVRGTVTMTRIVMALWSVEITIVEGLNSTLAVTIVADNMRWMRARTALQTMNALDPLFVATMTTDAE